MSAPKTKKPDNYDELYPGRFLKSGLFKGRAWTLTIADVQLEKMPDSRAKGGEKWQGIVSFRETELQLSLNKTNGECIRGMFGKRIADWIGKRVCFFPKTVEAFGEEVEAIRVLGSPDIGQDMDVELSLGKKKGSATMKKTELMKKAAPPPKPAPVAEPEHDPKTGEVFADDSEQAAPF